MELRSRHLTNATRDKRTVSRVWHLNVEIEFTLPIVHVHISNLAAQTGASLFLHEHAPPFFPLVFGAGTDPAVTAISWTYNKTEGLTPAMLSSSGFTHLIAESPEIGHGEWNVVDRILGFQRWELNEQVLASLKRRTPWDVPLLEWTHFLEMEMTEKLWILERSH